MTSPRFTHKQIQYVAKIISDYRAVECVIDGRFDGIIEELSERIVRVGHHLDWKRHDEFVAAANSDDEIRVSIQTIPQRQIYFVAQVFADYQNIEMIEDGRLDGLIREFAERFAAKNARATRDVFEAIAKNRGTAVTKYAPRPGDESKLDEIFERLGLR